MADDLSFAIIGGGFMGKAYSLALADLPIYCSPLPLRPVRELVVEATDELAANAQQRLGFNRTSTDWRSAVEDPGVDVVTVLLPNHMHHDVVLAALAAGKHVVCEKPLATNLDDARRMAELWRRPLWLRRCHSSTGSIPLFATRGDGCAAATPGRYGCCMGPTCRTGCPDRRRTTGGSSRRAAGVPVRSQTSACTGVT